MLNKAVVDGMDCNSKSKKPDAFGLDIMEDPNMTEIDELDVTESRD